TALRTLLSEKTKDNATVDVTEIEVGPLSDDDSQKLSEHLLKSANIDSTEIAEIVARESAGNPYLIDALVRHFIASGTQNAQEKAFGLDEMLWERISILPDSAKELMNVIAV